MGSSRDHAPSAGAVRVEAHPENGYFRKLPVVIEAFRLGSAWPDWWADAVSANRVITQNSDGRWRGGPDVAWIGTLEGAMRAEFGDWIIKGVAGEIYPCKPDIFALTYEPVADGAERHDAAPDAASGRTPKAGG